MTRDYDCITHYRTNNTNNVEDNNTGEYSFLKDASIGCVPFDNPAYGVINNQYLHLENAVTGKANVEYSKLVSDRTMHTHTAQYY